MNLTAKRSALRKIFSFLLILTLISSMMIRNTFAATYIYWPFGYHYAKIDIDNYTYLWSPYFNPTAKAINSWNTSGLSTRRISPSTSSQNKVYVQYSDSWFEGKYEQLVYDTSYSTTREYFTTKFQIVYNSRTTTGAKSEKLDFIACHELGHALGLDHNDNQVDPSKTIMRSSSEYYIRYTTPQPYDIAAVNAGWPHW